MTGRGVWSCLLVAGVLLVSHLANAFYLPGLAPVNFCEQSQRSAKCPSNVTLFVNKLDSDQSVIPYEYHSFDFCVASEDDSPVENLGQVIFGERIRPSPYQISFKETKQCALLCEKNYDLNKSEDKDRMSLLQRAMKLNYQHHWIIDNMPVTFCFRGCYVTPDGRQKDACVLDTRYSKADSYYPFNHVDIKIEYRDLTKDANFLEHPVGGRIIRIKVQPRSIKHESADKLDCSQEAQPLALSSKDSKSKIIYTYSIIWETTNVKWSSRWDYILDSTSRMSQSIQWYSIINSLVIVLFLSGMVGMILLRTLHRDITRYNKLDSEDYADDEVGWKLVHGDVFRTPRHPLLLSVFVGAGSQLLLCSSITLIFACLGFLSPANRGSLMTFALVFYVLFGIVAGYVSARLYKFMSGVNWKSNIVLTSTLVPGILFSVFFITNLMLWAKGSSAAVPFGTLVALLSLWLFVSLPLSFVGSFFGLKAPSIQAPVRTNQIPRQVPPQTLYTRPIPGIFLGGVLSFGVCFIQLFFILSSIWAHQVFYMFGFLSIVFLILIVTCSLTTALLAYFHLCSEDYRWWWRSFMTSGSAAFYLFAYCVHYLSKLSITGTISTILYFSYTGIFVFLFFLMTGTIGFFATLLFVHSIYSSIKVD